MPRHKTFSGELPLMQVSEQQPQGDHNRKPDSNKFRLNLHTFVDSRSYSVPSTNLTNTDGVLLQQPPAKLASSAYKRIAFATAYVSRPSTAEDGMTPLGQPKRKKRRTTQSSGKIRLRNLKPSSSSSNMHADAWSIILAHTRPSFVMQMRTVSKFFYHITNTDTIWRDAREHHFGVDMPPRPSFLTERQYASLLDGRGCQNPQCERRETRKVRWVFRLRLCDECLSRKLEIYKPDGNPSPQSRYASMFQTVADREQFGTCIVDLLPTSGTWSGKPNAPRRVHDETGKWSTRFVNHAPLLYLKSDFAALQEEWKTIQEEDWEAQRVLNWVREQYTKATLIAKTAYELDVWESGRLMATVTGGYSIRKHRVNYFTLKARQLVPPITAELLSYFSAYHTSLASSNPPSERAWDTLLSKILPYREQAEAVYHYVTTRVPRFGQPGIISPGMAIFDKLHEHRKSKRKETGRWSTEQRFILDFAEEEFNKLVDNVADEDLLLLLLRNTYNGYQRLPKKPQGLNIDGKIGEYCLTLDDAKLIVEEVVEKRIKRSTLRGVKVLESLRCMGCTRFTTGKRYSFQSAFEHMLDKHAKLVGKDLYFHNFLKYTKVPNDCLLKDYKFPWYLVEWTRSLPLLPTHAEITSDTRWIPDEDVPYVQLSTPVSQSAFEGRHAIPQEPSVADFVANFVYAAETMSTTRLEHECIVKIAIKYGIDLSGPTRPSIDDFFACIKPTQDIGSGLTFKFRCGACNRRPEVNSHLRCVKHCVDISLLRKHWDDKHVQEGIDWSTNFMDLPSDSALFETMLIQDEKLQNDQATSVERETIGLQKSAKKVRDQKAAALMSKEMAMEAFGRLFARNDEESY